MGGAFKLVDHEGKPFSDGDMKGGFSLVSILGSIGVLYKNGSRDVADMN